MANYKQHIISKMKGLQSKITLPSWLKKSPRIIHLKITAPLVPKKVELVLKKFQEVSTKKDDAMFISLNGIESNPEHAQVLHDAIKTTNQSLRIPIYTFLEHKTTALSYYIATSGQHIIANPFCLMGEFTTPHKTYRNVSKLLAYFGVNMQNIGTKKSNFWQEWAEPSEIQRQITKRWLELIHKNLKTTIAQKRNMKEEAIDEIGNKLISPTKALQLKLIDSIGTVEQTKQTFFPNHKLQEITLSLKLRNHAFTKTQIDVLKEVKTLMTMPRTVMLSMDDPIAKVCERLMQIISFRLSDKEKLGELDEMLGMIMTECETEIRKVQFQI